MNLTDKTIKIIKATVPIIEKNYDIAEKHASLNIKPVQYSVVIKCMLEAIGNVLGTKGTHAVKSAWEEALDNYANIIIEAETRKYEETLAKEGG